MNKKIAFATARIFFIILSIVFAFWLVVFDFELRYGLASAFLLFPIGISFGLLPDSATSFIYIGWYGFLLYLSYKLATAKKHWRRYALTVAFFLVLTFVGCTQM